MRIYFVGKLGDCWLLAPMASLADLPCCCAVAKVIEQRCFNTTPDPFNGQRVNFILKPPKDLELMLKKTNLECY